MGWELLRTHSLSKGKAITVDRQFIFSIFFLDPFFYFIPGRHEMTPGPNKFSAGKLKTRIANQLTMKLEMEKTFFDLIIYFVKLDISQFMNYSTRNIIVVQASLKTK